jgi:hypothetical protein
MKLINLSLLVLAAFLFTACPGIQTESAQQKLFKNHMDFPDLKQQYYKGIKFQLSSMFEDEYNTDYVLKQDAMTRIIYDELDLNFSVEAFTKQEADLFKYNFEYELDRIDAVHNHYAIMRENSLYDYFSSIKKFGPKEQKLNTIIQTIEGTSYDGAVEMTYYMATIEVKDTYYVFQLIGVKDHMGYLYDDFLDIVKSVKQ